MADEINMNSLVLMHYSLTLTNGTEIESSFDDEPVEITLGNGDVTEGMELALFGLKEGDTQTLTLTAEQGFGIRDEDNIHDMPLSDFPENLSPEVGLSYSFESPEDGDIPGTVLSIKDGAAKIDFNHPLAGQQIIFTVEILGINNAHSEIESN
ncbi:MAG: peptidylprolyl isomerase [Proteobacteria bacterium]|nr:peptidylprolyl isomerase [Pseudomonadota bacterium]